MKFNVMFVDDSMSVLESLQWIFKDEPYSVFFSENPLNALSVTKTLEWAVVVVDQSMQNMDGLEFMNRFQAQSPHTMGIIMTGYNEMKDALDTLHPGCVYRFVKKPLDNNEIKQAVKMAITQYEINAGTKGHEIYR
jgi:DNA-binding NtrC family response regulator